MRNSIVSSNDSGGDLFSDSGIMGIEVIPDPFGDGDLIIGQPSIMVIDDAEDDDDFIQGGIPPEILEIM